MLWDAIRQDFHSPGGGRPLSGFSFLGLQARRDQLTCGYPMISRILRSIFVEHFKIFISSKNLLWTPLNLQGVDSFTRSTMTAAGSTLPPGGWIPPGGNIHAFHDDDVIASPNTLHARHTAAGQGAKSKAVISESDNGPTGRLFA
jgi:hypothetical protein